MKMKRAAWKVLITIVLGSIMALGGAQAQTTRHRIDATCKDGSASSATGSGACSHHGGVSCWQYSDGRCTKPYVLGGRLNLAVAGMMLLWATKS
jgi:hypothetical protein